MKLRKVCNLILYGWYLVASIVPFVAVAFLVAYWTLRIVFHIASL